MAKLKGRRGQRGMYLIELIAALAISGFLAVILGASLSSTMRFSSGAQNQLMAADVAQELLDRFRDYYVQNLYSVPNGVYAVHLDSNDGVTPSNYPFALTPLRFDVTNLTYQGQTLASSFGGSLVGTVNVTLANGPNPATDRLVTVNVNWAENQAIRTYSLSTIITQYGTHVF